MKYEPTFFLLYELGPILLLAMAQNQETLSGSLQNLQEEIKEIQEEKKDKVYTDDELSLLTVVELKSILINKGHTNPYTDPLAPRSKEKRDSLIAKIKSIQ